MKRVFYFNITYRCNYRCRYCFSHTTHGSVQRHEIDLSNFKESLSQFCVGKGDRIVLNGGEPTLHTKFMEIVNVSLDTCSEVVLYSNGAVLSDQGFAQELFSRKGLRVTIPIHGDEEVHDYVTQCQGSWSRASQAISNISSFGSKKCLEPKFIISDMMAMKAFDTRNFLVSTVDNWETVCDVVIAGQVNTFKARKNGACSHDAVERMSYAEREIIKTSSEMWTKFYDLALCRCSEGFRQRFSGLRVFDPDIEIYFSDGNCPPCLRTLPKTARLKDCRLCHLRHVCTSICNSYCVTQIYKDVIERTLE